MVLTQKETDLLKDLKNQEKLCIDKYSKHSECAKDPQLKSLFKGLAETEQRHLDTLCQIENGTVPSLSGAENALPTFTASYCTDSADKTNDCYLCNDLLTMEKHASSLYDTCSFEINDENARNVLNNIQKQEQTHGKMIYDYMKANNMQ